MMATFCVTGSAPEPRPAKCVKISGDEPVVIPNPRSVCGEVRLIDDT